MLEITGEAMLLMTGLMTSMRDWVETADGRATPETSPGAMSPGATSPGATSPEATKVGLAEATARKAHNTTSLNILVCVVSQTCDKFTRKPNSAN